MIELICTRTCGTCRKARALLDERGIPYRYREYTEQRLTEAELREVLGKLGVGPREVLRAKDAAKHQIAPDLDDDALIAAMVSEPRLLQRPIGVKGARAVLGRPIEALLALG